MDLAIHGVNKIKKNFLLSSYSLTTQIVIINLSTTCLALIFLIIFNIFLLTSDKNINDYKKIVKEKISKISEHLSQNAIKRIANFNDKCTGVPRENKNNKNLTVKDPNFYIDCDPKNFNNSYEVNIENRPPQLDPTYTQQYIYSNFLNLSFNTKIISDSLIKFADTSDFYSDGGEVVISDIDNTINQNNIKKIVFTKFMKIFI